MTIAVTKLDAEFNSTLWGNNNSITIPKSECISAAEDELPTYKLLAEYSHLFALGFGIKRESRASTFQPDHRRLAEILTSEGISAPEDEFATLLAWRRLQIKRKWLAARLQSYELSFSEILSKESTSCEAMITTPDRIQEFFQHSERVLSTKTENTAQVALKLLRRIKDLVLKLSPSSLRGRILAVVDDEDGSTTIEWICNRSRLGFVLDLENESSWFVVLPNRSSKSGYLYRDSGLPSLRGLLEEFITAGD